MKKVSFSECDIIHNMYTWRFAYHTSRKRFWEYFAIDRERFRRRIELFENISKPFFDCKFRNTVYENRFK